MDFNTFADLIRALAEEAKTQNVSITLQIYPDYSELTIEPFQPVKAIRNNGSVSEYVFGGDNNE